MNNKLKRQWELLSHGQQLAQGVVYRELNVQILHRYDIGWTAQQLSSLQGLFELFPMADTLHIEPLQKVHLCTVTEEDNGNA